MTVSAKYDAKLEIDEEIDLGLDHVTDPEITHSLGNHTGTLKSDTSPPATKAWSDSVTLTAGSASLDLTALARGNLPNVDLTGLKVQLVKLSCPSTNTQAIEVDKGSSNGYNLFGPTNATAEKLSVVPGGVALLVYDDELEDVDATHKAIDLTGTGTETIDVALVAG